MGIEKRVNQLDIEIDEFATRLLALYQPVAKDLRFLTAAIKINSDLGRMGDLAINIGQRSVSLLSQPHIRPLVDIAHMSRTVEAMVRRSLDAFVQRDETMAVSVLMADDEVDDLNKFDLPGTPRHDGKRCRSRQVRLRSNLHCSQPRTCGGPRHQHRRGRFVRDQGR